jgi:hypothetical protein
MRGECDFSHSHSHLTQLHSPESRDLIAFVAFVITLALGTISIRGKVGQKLEKFLRLALVKLLPGWF